MHAEGTFTVEPVYPEALAPLADLARNLRWVWHGPTQDLFSTVAPEVWAATRDPLEALRGADQARVAALGGDTEFVALVRALHADLNDYLTRPAWADELTDGAKGIAYFSMEFGVSQTLPNYSGGLGVLAGDHLKAASDLGLPLIALGLLYRHGYFQQSLSADGWQLEAYPELRDQALPLDFLQSAEPKLDEDLAPVEWPADPSLEWCPPGHGDVYVSLAQVKKNNLRKGDAVAAIAQELAGNKAPRLSIVNGH